MKLNIFIVLFDPICIFLLLNYDFIFYFLFFNLKRKRVKANVNEQAWFKMLTCHRWLVREHPLVLCGVTKSFKYQIKIDS